MNFRSKIKKTLALALTTILSFTFNSQSFSANQANSNPETMARNLLAQLTQSEKIQLVHGESPQMIADGTGAGVVKGIPRLGIPDIRYADSAAGVPANSPTATGLPSNLALAAAWDRQLSHNYGQRIAIELKKLGFNGGLGGGINLAREPRGGRTFEYLGEDPILAGELVSARTEGTQSQNVLATVKHFAMNNQETHRFTSNSIADEKTMREMYLRGFEIAVKKANPAMVMCGYNKVNGEKDCENKWLLTDVLKGNWGYKGFVQSDWVFAVTDPTKAANAGLDEEEPGSPVDILPPPPVPSSFNFNQRLQVALATNQVSQQRLDDMVLRKLRTLIRFHMIGKPAPSPAPIDVAAGRQTALKTEENAITLLKNKLIKNSPALPLQAKKIKSIAIIGGHADKAVIGGGGSAQSPTKNKKPVNCDSNNNLGGAGLLGTFQCAAWQQSSIVNSLKRNLPHAKITYLDGSDISKAKAAAKKADLAVVVATQYSTEQFDLHTLGLPSPAQDYANQQYDQVALINGVSAAAKKSVVVLENATAVTMPWLNKVDAVLATWFPGEMGGQAIANVLTGVVNPSGRLPLTFPRSENDLPQKAINPDDLNVVYKEGTKVGYRWYQAKNIKPLFPFGFGLSYTNFQHSSPTVNRLADGKLKVTFTVKNIGSKYGKDVPQIYIKLPGDNALKLLAWDKISLKPGESTRVNLTIPAELTAVWNKHHWMVPGGKAKVYLAKSAMDSSALIKTIYLKPMNMNSGA